MEALFVAGFFVLAVGIMQLGMKKKKPQILQFRKKAHGGYELEQNI